MTEAKYHIWDKFDAFTLHEAVYLWQDKEPPTKQNLCAECERELQGVRFLGVYGSTEGQKIAEILERHGDIRDRRNATRDELIKVAQKEGMKPKFLFPEDRKGDAFNQPNLEDKPLSTKERNSYLKLIKGLLHKQGIPLADRGIAKQLVGYITDANQSLGDDKVREILKEVQNLAED